MCGIFGIWHRDGRRVDVDALDRASKLIRHRGPDDEGFLLVNTTSGGTRHAAGDDTYEHIAAPHVKRAADQPFDFGFAFRRLAIVDLSPLGHQPMASSDGRFWLMFNGEIYNYVEIRAELQSRGHTFRSTSDTEVVLAAYIEWREQCLQRFNGMWGIAVWDNTERTLFLARDRFGVKPLHYVDRDGTFAFSSEIKALVGTHTAAFRPNARAVYDYIAYGRQPSPQRGLTFYEGIRSLPPGHWLRVTRDSVREERFYDLRARTCEHDATSEEERVRAFRELLGDSVRLRLHADVPVGTCLSGGLDSSSIVVLTNGYLGEAGPRGTNARQKTFSAVYDEVARYNERAFVETVVSMTRAESHYVTPTAERLISEGDRLVWHQEEPFGSTSIFAQWCVMALARSAGVTVLLDGQGADEALGGYVPFDVHVAELVRRGHLPTAWRELMAARRVMGMPALATLLKAVLWTLPSAAHRAASRVRARGATSVLASEFAGQHAHAPAREGKRADLSGHLYDEVERNLPELLRYEDRNSMAFHIEARVPFVDYRVMEFCFARARELRVRDGWTKYLLRRAMSDSLPREIAWRRDKVGFETPEARWLPLFLRARRDEWRDGLLSAEFVDARAFHDHVDRAVAGQGTPRLLWRLVNLELWLRSWQSAPALSAATREPVGA